MVLPSRATSAKTVQQRKGRGTEQENSVQREKERKRLINITLHIHSAKKERENSLELRLHSMCKSIFLNPILWKCCQRLVLWNYVPKFKRKKLQFCALVLHSLKLSEATRVNKRLSLSLKRLKIICYYKFLSNQMVSTMRTSVLARLRTSNSKSLRLWHN